MACVFGLKRWLVASDFGPCVRRVMHSTSCDCRKKAYEACVSVSNQPYLCSSRAHARAFEVTCNINKYVL